MSRVRDILNYKRGRQQYGDVVTIAGDATALKAVQKMVDRNVGSVVVTNPTGGVVGIFTERDYLRRIVLQNRRSNTTLVRDVMSDHLHCVEPERSLDECMDTMTNRRIRHIPVLEYGRLVGIVSLGDLVKYLSLERGSEIKYLTDYITGQYPGEMGSGL